MKVMSGGLENVPGYVFSAVECGIKYEGRLDFSMIFSGTPCTASGMFTTNRIFAAPVRLCRERIGSPVHGILINATNANACTGDEGYRNAAGLTAEAARLTGVKEDSFLMASTGVIGVQLPAARMSEALPRMIGARSRENGRLIPRAIMTTDTVPKEIAVSFETSQGERRIAGTAKGVGMIAPDMATLLCFVITDMPVSKPDLDAVFRRCVSASLNAITIDGDMSTNDTALILAPAHGNPASGMDITAFEESLAHVLRELAEMLVRDGEGATKFVTVSIAGARTDEDARRAARSICESLLVKTALFGRDPNWGRIACAAGYSGAEVREDSLTITVEGTILLKKGKPQPYDRPRLIEALGARDVSVTVDLGMGNASAVFRTCDISYDYVKINAEYTT